MRGNDNLIYEQWHFARPKLVAMYLCLFRDGPGDPIALQSPRRWGKTTFLGRISRLSQIVRKLFKCAVVALFKRPRRTQLVEELALLRHFAEGLRAQRYCRRSIVLL